MAQPIALDLKDGAPRFLKFGASALGRFERTICSGVGFYVVFAGTLSGRPPFYVISGLLWAALTDPKHGNPLLTHEAVCQLIDEYVERSGDQYDGYVWAAIVEALYEAKVFRDPTGELDPKAEGVKENSPSPGGLTN